jgi:calcium/calmodulin-dependent protein kinase I
MGSQKYVTDKVWLVEGEEMPEEEAKVVDIDLKATPVGQKYDVGPTIGSGAFSQVKDAKDKASKKPIALKVLSQELNPSFNISQAQQEFTITSSLKCENIVSAIESFNLSSKSFVIALEKCDSELFAKIIEQSSRSYSEEDAKNYIKQLLVAVAAIHSQNIVHRDIVPENLMLLGGKLKLIGFSMATKSTGTNQFDGVVGTQALQPPEIINRQNFCLESDMWSVGVISFALLSGKFPFHDSNAMRLSMKIRKGEYEITDPDFKNVSPEAKAFVKSLINVDPKARKSAKDALNDPWFKKAGNTQLPSFYKNFKLTLEQNAWNC